MRIEKMLQGYELEDALRLVGLARRRSPVALLVSAAGLLAAGAAIGAGIGLALAPSSGRQLREGMSGRLDQIRDKIKRDADKYSHANATSTPSSP
jgi:hypothetical protein